MRLLYFISIFIYLVSCKSQLKLVSVPPEQTAPPEQTPPENTEVIIPSWTTLFHSTNPNIISNAGNEWCEVVERDSRGNIYLGCYTNGSIFANNPGNSGQGVIVKLDAFGQFIWGIQINEAEPLIQAGTGYNNVRGLAINEAEEVFFIGWTWSSIAETAGGGSDAYYGKISKEGNLVWVKQLGTPTMAQFAIDSGYGAAHSTNDEWINSIVILPDGKLAMTGSSQSTLSDDNSSGNHKLFFLKASPTDGSIINLKQWGDNWLTSYIGGGGYASANIAQDMSGRYMKSNLEIDEQGNLYSHIVSANPLVEPNGGSDYTYYKIDSNFNIIWIKQIGNTTTANYASQPGNFSSADNSGSEVHFMMTYRNGYIYLGGVTDGDLGDLNHSSPGKRDPVVIKVNATNGNVVWIWQGGLNSGAGSDNHEHTLTLLEINSQGEIFFGGNTEGDYAGMPKTGTYDPYFSKLSAEGVLLKSTYFGGSPEFKNLDGNQFLAGLSITENDRLIISFENTQIEQNKAPTGYDINIYHLTESEVFD